MDTCKKIDCGFACSREYVSTFKFLAYFYEFTETNRIIMSVISGPDVRF
jgi:hypothetical protein